MPDDAIRFEWSDRKAVQNLRKHRVSFAEAETVFDDDHALILPDEWHVDDEPREIIIGYSYRHRLLFVAFIERAINRIRLISARLANRKERQAYGEEERF